MKKLYACLAVLCFVLQVNAQFSGAYITGNWSTVLSAGSNGSVNTSAAPGSITITGSNSATNVQSAQPVNTDFTIITTTSGVWRFNWTYHTNDIDIDPKWDIAGILINGAFTPLTGNTDGVDQSGSFTAPSVTAGTVIGFRISAVDNAYGNATFTVSGFSAPGSTLPLTLTGFTAKQQEEKVVLHWTTTQESKLSGFEIERSADGSRFTKLTSVAARNTQGMQAYDAADESPLPGTSYYRLRIKEQDGGERTSPVAVVKRNGVLTVQVYPNPVKGGLVVTVTAAKRGREKIEVVDAAGRTLQSNMYDFLPGRNSIPMDGGFLSKGIYYLRTQDKVVSFIKE